MSLQQTPMAQHSEPFETMAKLLFVDKDIIDPSVPQLLGALPLFLCHGRPVHADPARLERALVIGCLLYTSPSPRDRQKSRMPSSA